MPDEISGYLSDVLSNSGSRSDRLVAKFHKPEIVVVIPHFNYSEFLDEALLSVQQQTYDNFHCVVVDDRSEEHHFVKVSELVARLNDTRFSVVRNTTNVGMVHSICRGMDQSDAAFVSILDPDDRYAPSFLERLLQIHLSPALYCPLVCCDQYLYRIGDGIITSTARRLDSSFFDQEKTVREQKCFLSYGFHRYVWPTENGWHWTSTSSMMFRADALRLIVPTKDLAYRGNGDDYFANGAHMLGGSILLHEPLVYRGLHKNNDYMSEAVFSMFRRYERKGAQSLSEIAKIDVVESFLKNGGLAGFNIENFLGVIYAQFPGARLTELIEKVPEIKELIRRQSNES